MFGIDKNSLFTFTFPSVLALDKFHKVNVIAPDAETAIKLVEAQGRDYSNLCIEMTENPSPALVPVSQFNRFVGRFYAGEFPQQRLGQAFLNEFKDIPAVDAYRYGGYLWEEKNTNVAVDKITGAGLLDWSN